MDSRREEDCNEDYNVEEISGEMNNKDIHSKDGCGRTNGKEEYHSNERIPVRTAATR